MDMVLFRDFPGHSDLVFGCDLSHDFSERFRPYYSKDKILTHRRLYHTARQLPRYGQLAALVRALHEVLTEVAFNHYPDRPKPVLVERSFG
jgi:hypothetical protein